MVKILVCTILLFLNIQVRASEEFVLEPAQFTLDHNRPDLRLDKLWIMISCLNSKGQGTSNCATVHVGGIENTNNLLQFDAHWTTSVLTDEIRILFRKDNGVFFCLSLKVLFHGYSNQNDFVLYQDLNDRYSVLTYCNTDTLPDLANSNPRFSHRRVRSWKAFAQAFISPVPILLKPATN